MSLDSGELSSADDAGRYRLDERIATGGMGEVWRGTDTVLARPVAVKMLKHEYADDPLFRARFESEARHAGGLHHAGVAQVFDFGIQGARPYLVMELVEGKPLNALLTRGRPMDAEVARDLVAQAASALGAAHALGIVHRDVKPANLIVTPDQRVKVTDFGIARAADSVALTETGQVLGTPQYLSPEQAEGSPTSPASDVYALGVIGYECLAGRRPFEAESAIATALAHLRQPVPDLPADVPADLAAVVRRALAKDPSERYVDGAALAEALGSSQTASAAPALAEPVPATQVLTGVVPATATAPTFGERTGALTSAVRRVPVPLLAAGAVFVLVVAVALAANLTSGGADSGPAPAGGGSTQVTHTSAPTTPPATRSTTSQSTSPSTTPSTTPKGPKPPKGHGHGHGKGKGHQK
ncbi:MAG: serine/threonine-protein kinase [Nocardioides sp.]